MPQRGKRWRHVILNTHCSWLHGAERGFRARRHRIHSSGDYRNPPPADEHEGLREFHRLRSRRQTLLTTEMLSAVGDAIVRTFARGGYRVLCVSVNPTHVHALVELPDSVRAIRRVCGWCKYHGTRAVRVHAPELRDREVWADGEGYDPVDNRRHQLNTYRYILKKQGSDAWTWCYRTGASW